MSDEEILEPLEDDFWFNRYINKGEKTNDTSSTTNL